MLNPPPREGFSSRVGRGQRVEKKGTFEGLVGRYRSGGVVDPSSKHLSTKPDLILINSSIIVMVTGVSLTDSTEVVHVSVVLGRQHVTLSTVLGDD